MNKRIFFILMLIMNVLLLSACKDNSKKERVSLPYPVYDKIPSAWEAVIKKDKIFLAKFDGELYIFFSGQGESRFGIGDAKNKAQMNALLLAASAIKEVVKIQIHHVETKGKTGTIKTRVKIYIEKRVSENVNVSGLVAVKSRIYRDSKNTGLKRIIMLYGLPYRVYKSRRSKALREIQSEKLLSSQKLKLLKADFSKLD